MGPRRQVRSRDFALLALCLFSQQAVLLLSAVTVARHVIELVFCLRSQVFRDKEDFDSLFEPFYRVQQMIVSSTTPQSIFEPATLINVCVKRALSLEPNC